MKKATLLFVFLFFFFAGSYAQYYTNQNKVWVFGYNAGLSFTSGVPVPFWSNIHTDEGSASVSDTAGNLLLFLLKPPPVAVVMCEGFASTYSIVKCLLISTFTLCYLTQPDVYLL